jgi:hypothetical protein
MPSLAPDLDALAVHDVVDAIIVFEGIHAADVVVVIVLIAPDEPASLVLFAGNGLEGNGKRYVLVFGVLCDTRC